MKVKLHSVLVNCKLTNDFVKRVKRYVREDGVVLFVEDVEYDEVF